MCRLGASSEACTPHLTFQYEAMLVLYDINNSASVFIKGPSPITNIYSKSTKRRLGGEGGRANVDFKSSKK